MTSPVDSAKYKTRLCRHALKGNCTAGAECNFLHEGDDSYAKEYEFRQETIERNAQQTTKPERKLKEPREHAPKAERRANKEPRAPVHKRPTKQITITARPSKPDILSIDQLDKLVRACKALPESCEIDLDAIMSACDTLKTSIGKINEFMEFVNVVTKPN
jgi:hypothetical protein